MSAIISRCGLYRYRLERKLSNEKRACAFIMLNPSTADAELDDPTIRRCKSFAQRLICGKLIVVNLFAFRATKPVDLYKAADPIGPDNDKHIVRVFDEADIVICGWGSNPTQGRDEALASIAKRNFITLRCLGKTKQGHPRHPLFVLGDAPLEVWR